MACAAVLAVAAIGLVLVPAAAATLRIDSVRLLGDTAIKYTRVGPANLILSVTAPRKAAVGQRIPVLVRVANTGGRTARHVTVSASLAGAEATIVGASTRRLPPLRPGQSRAVRILYIPTQPGHTRLFFLGSSTANSPGKSVDVVTVGAGPARGAPGPPQPTGRPWLLPMLLGVGAAVLTAVGGAVWAYRGRPAREDREGPMSVAAIARRVAAGVFAAITLLLVFFGVGTLVDSIRGTTGDLSRSGSLVFPFVSFFFAVAAGAAARGLWRGRRRSR